YALIIRSLVTLEGIAINVDPEFKVLSKAYPYVAKRLLTDSSPELRTSLRELLFKDGSFRWNRLENLLKNARTSDDYDLGAGLNQALDFVFSDRGSFVRERIVEEVVKNVDLLTQDAARSTRAALGELLGWQQPVPSNGRVSVKVPQERQALEHIKRILTILRDTPGFDAMDLLPRVPQLLVKPETQRMGQEIASNLAQRFLARMIRNLLLDENPVQHPVQHTEGSRRVPKLPPGSPTSR
ncbi:AarF/ABC1/UbiB kinase family protein, partial [Oscillatoriales cyanobacterium LEGE 11467]|nr:AarF/ABC1/UbiB kinase family protein [Zarconia navalis LEGE 11467]